MTNSWDKFNENFDFRIAKLMSNLAVLKIFVSTGNKDFVFVWQNLVF